MTGSFEGMSTQHHFQTCAMRYHPSWRRHPSQNQAVKPRPNAVLIRSPSGDAILDPLTHSMVPTPEVHTLAHLIHRVTARLNMAGVTGNTGWQLARRVGIQHLGHCTRVRRCCTHGNSLHSSRHSSLHTSTEVRVCPRLTRGDCHC